MKTEPPTAYEPRPDRCETCRFWQAYTDQGKDEDPRGDCHRQSPIAIPVMLLPDGENTGGSWTYWPETEGREWCGEWQGMIR